VLDAIVAFPTYLIVSVGDCHFGKFATLHQSGRKAESRIQWRISLLTNLRQQMAKMSTDESLQETIIDCLNRAMANRPIYPHGIFHHAMEAQAKIGLVHMLQGYWSLEWQKAYENSYQIPIDEDRKTKKKRLLHMVRWQKKIIVPVWGAMISLWKLRNDKQNRWDKESRDRSRREVLHHELAEIYGRQHKYPARVQQLL
jgi:hypothetical protein